MSVMCSGSDFDNMQSPIQCRNGNSPLPPPNATCFFLYLLSICTVPCPISESVLQHFQFHDFWDCVPVTPTEMRMCFLKSELKVLRTLIEKSNGNDFIRIYQSVCSAGCSTFLPMWLKKQTNKKLYDVVPVVIRMNESSSTHANNGKPNFLEASFAGKAHVKCKGLGKACSVGSALRSVT